MKFPQIKDITKTHVVLLHESRSLQEAVDKMDEFNLRDIVIDRGIVGEYGILLIQDILQIPEHQFSLNHSIVEVGYRNLPSISRDTDISNIFGLFSEEVNYLAIVDNNELYGIVSQTDIISHIDPKILIEGQRLREIINRHAIKSTDQNTPIQTVFSLMNTFNDAIILTQADKPVGIITTKNALKAIKHQAPPDCPARNFMTSPLETVCDLTTVRNALEYLRQKHFKRLVVTDKNGHIKGVVTQQDLIFYAYINWHRLTENKSKLIKFFSHPEKLKLANGQVNSQLEPEHHELFETMSPSHKSSGEQYVLTSLREIAARQKAEQALMESEARFRAQYKSIPIPTFTWQKQENVIALVDFNDAALDMTDGDVINYLGASAENLLNDFPEIIKDLKKCIREKNTFKNETRLTLKTKKLTLEVIATYVFIPPDLVMIHIEDITEKQQAQEKLRALLNDMEAEIHHRSETSRSLNTKVLEAEHAINQAEDEKLRHLAELAHLGRISLMGEMATSIAHELNQPLTAITTYCEAALRMIENNKLNTENLTNVLTNSRNQALRAGEIIRHLRQLTSKQKTEVRMLNLNEIIQLTLDFSNNRLLRHGIQIVLQLDDNIPKVLVDKIQVEQVFLNIINNAIDALKLKRNIIRKLTIRSFDNYRGYVQIEIEDNGPGMDEPTLARIFDRFHSTKDGIGMGMGLPICRTIMESHRGSLWVKAEKDQGAVFYITFPIQR